MEGVFALLHSVWRASRASSCAVLCVLHMVGGQWLFGAAYCDSAVDRRVLLGA